MDIIRNLEGPSKEALEETKYLVIFLHGWGSDGNDLIQLANYWQEDLKNATFLAPNGPEVCSANEQGRQWFDILSDDKKLIYAGLELAYLDLKAYISKQLDIYKLEKEKYFLVGFSQGTMLALHTGIRRKCLGLLGYSGGLIDYHVPKTLIKNKILLLHGKEDAIVPVRRMYHASNLLKSFSIEVGTIEYDNLEHSINDKGLKDGVNFIKDYI